INNLCLIWNEKKGFIHVMTDLESYSVESEYSQSKVEEAMKVLYRDVTFKNSLQGEDNIFFTCPKCENQIELRFPFHATRQGVTYNPEAVPHEIWADVIKGTYICSKCNTPYKV